jgi:hypothetical protein
LRKAALIYDSEFKRNLPPLKYKDYKIILSVQSSSVYKVGDRSPAGGWVFCDKGNYADGWRYLEAAPRAMELTWFED